MDKRDWSIIVTLGVVLIVLISFFVWVGMNVYEDTIALSFCNHKGYNMVGRDSTINNIRYIECCRDAIKNNEFVDDCKIFRRD